MKKNAVIRKVFGVIVVLCLCHVVFAQKKQAWTGVPMRNAGEEMVIPYDLTFRIDVDGEQYVGPVEGAYVFVYWKWYSFALGKITDEQLLHHGASDSLGFIEPYVIRNFSTTWYDIYWASIWVQTSYGTLYFHDIPMKGICISAYIVIFPKSGGCISVNYGNGEYFDDAQNFKYI